MAKSVEEKYAKSPAGTEFSVGSAARFWIVIFILAALIAAALIINVNTGSVHIEPLRVIKLIFGGDDGTTESRILFGIRLPRLLLASVLGGALAVSGLLLQTFFRNPIAGPFVLGISSGAKMLVGITVIFFARGLAGAGQLSLIAAAFIGSLIITGFVLLFSQKVKNMSMLLVIGIMVGYICSAVTDFCITFANEQDIVNLTHWSMGSFSGTGWNKVILSASVCLPAVLAAWLVAKPMGAYALGEGYAKSMGLNIKLFRFVLILLSSLLSACVTALAGPISFVGIAVPHITRSVLKSSRPSFVIPAAFLSGAVFCVFCDLIARTLLAPTELNIGTVTAAFGAPFVIYMMLTRRKEYEA